MSDGAGSTKRSLKEIRLEKGLDLQHISETLDLPTSIISAYEDNPAYIPIGLAVRLSSIYNTPLAEVDFGEE